MYLLIILLQIVLMLYYKFKLKLITHNLHKHINVFSLFIIFCLLNIKNYIYENV